MTFSQKCEILLPYILCSILFASFVYEFYAIADNSTIVHSCCDNSANLYSEFEEAQMCYNPQFGIPIMTLDNDEQFALISKKMDEINTRLSKLDDINAHLKGIHMYTQSIHTQNFLHRI